MLSITFFFSVLTAGLAATLPGVLFQGLTVHGIPAAVSRGISHIPPIGVLFAAFLGYNPMRSLIPPAVAGHLSAATQSVVFGKTFFPHLILPAFMSGLRAAFYVSALLAFIAAVASLLRGRRYIYDEEAGAGASAPFTSTGATAVPAPVSIGATSPTGASVQAAGPAEGTVAAPRLERPPERQPEHQPEHQPERALALLGLTLAVAAREAQQPGGNPAILRELSAAANGRYPPSWSEEQRGRATARDVVQPLATALLAAALRAPHVQADDPNGSNDHGHLPGA